MTTHPQRTTPTHTLHEQQRTPPCREMGANARCCAIKTVNSNNGFFMCSDTDSTRPTNGHVSLDAHLIVRRLASSPSGARKHKCRNLVPSTQPFRVHACLMAHHPHILTAPAVSNRNDSLCTELEWLKRVASAVPLRNFVLRTVNSCLPPIFNVASIVVTRSKLMINCQKKKTNRKPQHTTF